MTELNTTARLGVNAMDWVWRFLFFRGPEAGVAIDWTPRLPQVSGIAGALLFAGVALAAAGLARFLYVRIESRYVSERRRGLLAVLRSAAAFCLLFMFTGAYLRLDRETRLRGTVAVLIDRSASMGLADARSLDATQRLALARLTAGGGGEPPTPGNPHRIDTMTRLELAARALEGAGAEHLLRLRERFDVKLFTFGENGEATPLESDPDKEGLAETLGPADERASRLGDALRDVGRRLRGQQRIGVIAITDGAVNRGEDPADAAADLGAPVYAVGVGAAETRDLELRFVMMENVLFKGDQFPVTLRLRHSGLQGRAATLVVRRNETEVYREPIAIGAQAEWSHTFTLNADRKGTFVYEAEAVPFPDEVTANNNAKRRYDVKVVDEPIRVLVVEDKPRWEWRFLKTVLESDRKRIRPSYVLRAADSRAAREDPRMLRGFPQTADELRRFNLLILGDVPADSFTRQDLAHVEEFVRADGGWVILMAGRRYMPGRYGGTLLSPLVPVDVPAGSSAASGPESAAAGARPRMTEAGLDFRLLRLDPDETRNRELWNRAPRVFWHYRAAHAKPGAQVLVEADPGSGEDAAPLVVRQRYGSGSVLFVGTDETWRWRKLEGGDHHRRLWSQIVTEMGLDHMMGGESRVEITLGAQEVALGSEETVFARVRGPDMKPLRLESVACVIEDPDGAAQRLAMAPQPGEEGVYSARWTPLALGQHHLYLDTFREEADAVATVVPPRIEFDDPGLKETVLRRVAERSNGRYFPLTQIEELARHLLNQNPPTQIQRFEQPLWNAPGLLSLLGVLLGVEWFLRKRWDLM